MQGDVTGIIRDSDGALIVSYTYDAWGKVLSTTGSEASTIGKINPIRYRGYYYDNETGFYYLQSRYYDPEVGRFINADDPESMILQGDSSILATNLFAYCYNNPVNMMDPNGYFPKWINDFIRGVKDGFKSSFKGLINIFLHPFQTLKSIFNLKNIIKGSFDPFNFWEISWNLLKGNFYKAGFLYGGNLFKAVLVLLTAAVDKAINAIKSGKAMQFTDHGYKRAMGRDGGRGVSDSAIRNTIKNPTKVTPQPKNGTIRFESSQAVVVLNKSGKIVTTWAKGSKYYRK